MDKRIIFALFTLAFTTFAFAETCPSIKTIKSQHLAGWKAYDSDSGKPLDQRRSLDFVKSAEQFILAEWSARGTKGSAIHCFYRDVNGSDLEAYLTKDGLVPENNKKWYRVSGAMHCAAGNNMCSFAHIKEQPKFARR